MSLRILHPTRTAGKAQTFFAPTNRTLSRPLLNARNFAFYRRSIREADVAVAAACKIPRPLDRITPQSLWMQLKDGLSEQEYKDIAARIETHVTNAVAAYERVASRESKVSVADMTRLSAVAVQGSFLLQDSAFATSDGSTQESEAVVISLISKPAHPIFPGLASTAQINIQVFSDAPLLVELQFADDRIKFVFIQPEIVDADFSSTCSSDPSDNRGWDRL